MILKHPVNSGDIIAKNGWGVGIPKEVEVTGRFQRLSGLLVAFVWDAPFFLEDYGKGRLSFKLYGKRFYKLPYKTDLDLRYIAHNPLWWLVYFTHACLLNLERWTLIRLRRLSWNQGYELEPLMWRQVWPLRLIIKSKKYLTSAEIVAKLNKGLHD